MFDWTLYFSGLLITSLLLLLTWTVSLFKHDVSIVDSVWSLVLLALCATYFLLYEFSTTRGAIVLVLTAIWALRLSAHISWRNRGEPEDARYQAIREHEKHLAISNTLILKFYLHIDPEEQLERFKQRLLDPARHWKISEGDYAERPFWDAYTKAFEDALSKTSTEHAPWFVIPSNHKWFRNLAVSRIVAETLESLGMKFPAPTVDIDQIKQKYHAILQEEGIGEAQAVDEPKKQKKKGSGKKKKKG